MRDVIARRFQKFEKRERISARAELCKYLSYIIDFAGFDVILKSPIFVYSAPTVAVSSLLYCIFVI